MSDGGKGSSPRPFSVSQSEYQSNFDAIFRKPKDPKELDDAIAEDEAFTNILNNSTSGERDEPDRNTSNF